VRRSSFKKIDRRIPFFDTPPSRSVSSARKTVGAASCNGFRARARPEPKYTFGSRFTSFFFVGRQCVGRRRLRRVSAADVDDDDEGDRDDCERTFRFVATAAERVRFVRPTSVPAPRFARACVQATIIIIIIVVTFNTIMCNKAAATSTTRTAVGGVVADQTDYRCYCAVAVPVVEY